MIARPRTVLVTDAGRGSGIACIRSLGKKGWRVIAADADSRSAGFRSRYTAERLVYPAPTASPRAFVEALHAFATHCTIDLVIPVTDECIHPLAHARERFRGLTQLAIPSEQALELVTDKHETLALAARLGLAVPEARLVNSLEEARRAARELCFPVVLKPTISRRYFPEQDRIEMGAVTFARDLAELEARFVEGVGRHALLLQEYRPGLGVGVECLAHEGRVLRAFQHKRLAEIPVTGGASAWRESMPLDPELFEQARRLIAALRWSGLIMVEFKLGERPWFLEINGRIWGSLPLACLAGVDFPAELAELHCPGPEVERQAPAPYRVGLRAYNLELMLSWIAQVLLGRVRHAYLPRPGWERGLSGLVGLLDPAQKSDLADGHDLAPRLAEAQRIARKFTHKLVRPRREG